MNAQTKELLRIVTSPACDETFAGMVEDLWKIYQDKTNSISKTYRSANGKSVHLSVSVAHTEEAEDDEEEEENEQVNPNSVSSNVMEDEEGSEEDDEEEDDEEEESESEDNREEEEQSSKRGKGKTQENDTDLPQAENEEVYDSGDDEPAVGQKRSFSAFVSGQGERMLVCAKCKGCYPKSRFSAKQLRRMDKRKCKECTTFQFPARTGVPLKKLKPRKE